MVDTPSVVDFVMCPLLFQNQENKKQGSKQKIAYNYVSTNGDQDVLLSFKKL